MAAWPDVAELKQVLNVESDDWDTTLERVLAAAIAKVKSDIGAWDDNVDSPNASLAQAALRMAELMSSQPEGLTTRFVTAVTQDLTYQRLLTGQRRKFGIA